MNLFSKGAINEWPRGPENLASEWSNDPAPDLLWDALKLQDISPLLAIEDLEKLTNNGSALGAMYLGDTYLYGRGVLQDKETGESWMRRAAELGSIEGAHRLAKYYYQISDYDRAKEIFSQLDKIGFSPSTYLLGHIYYRGYGVDRNLLKAMDYWEKAEMMGHFHARHWRSFLLRNGEFGFFGRIQGYLSLLILLTSGVKCKLTRPDSDRLRDW